MTNVVALDIVSQPVGLIMGQFGIWQNIFLATLHCNIARPCHTPAMATYRIIAAGAAGYRAEATADGGMLHICGGLATEADAENWVAAHKRATESQGRTERRPSSPRDC